MSPCAHKADRSRKILAGCPMKCCHAASDGIKSDASKTGAITVSQHSCTFLGCASSSGFMTLTEELDVSSVAILVELSSLSVLVIWSMYQILDVENALSRFKRV